MTGKSDRKNRSKYGIFEGKFGIVMPFVSDILIRKEDTYQDFSSLKQISMPRRIQAPSLFLRTERRLDI